MENNQGIISVTKKGFAFIKDQIEKKYFVPKLMRGDSLHGDLVIFEFVEKSANENQADVVKVIKIIERKQTTIVGFVRPTNGRQIILSDDSKIQGRLLLSNPSIKLKNNYKMLFHIDKVKRNNIFVSPLKEIGHKDAIGTDVKAIMAAFGIEESFPIITSKQANKISNQVLPEEIIDRVDLRNEIIITIDGERAKDLDDAIRVEKLDNGHYLLGVYIADVAHYVKENDAIDQEANERGTSIYLADRVVPMLPENLSNGICSLTEAVDRLVLACEMEINDDGIVVDSKIFEAIIKTKYQMTYTTVNAIIHDNKKVVKQYHNLKKLINNAIDLAVIIRNRKVQKGMIEFEINDPQVILNDQGQAVDIVVKNREEAEKLIEDFMVITNETVATTIFNLKLPFIYRVHPAPQFERLAEFYKFAKHFGKHFEGKVENIEPRDVTKILNLYRQEPFFDSIAIMMLRTMEKAIYASENIGHFGLASSCYTHFTSPIRRYPDLIVHRLLKAYVINNQDKKVNNHWAKLMPEIAAHTSAREKRAIDCERATLAMKKAEWAHLHLNQEYTGWIATITNFGMFIKLENAVEGLIHVNEILDDYYQYVETKFWLIGEKTNRSFKPGDKVQVFIKTASKLEGKIDFGLIEFKTVILANMAQEKIAKRLRFKSRNKHFDKKR